jgi:nucleoside-diphosphate-sugar epimerase
MATRVFLAGATGVVGRRLVPLLNEAGYAVFGTTRREAKVSALKEAGVTPVVLNVFDAAATSAALLDIRPEIVIHQLTDLPPALDPAHMEEAIGRNARIRSEGTRNLVNAAIASGARRFIAQSIAWVYAPGPEPHHEGDPLDIHAEGTRAITIAGVAALEEHTLNSPPLEGVVLRYGRLYGPGTGVDGPGNDVPVHVDAAAVAALLAIDKALSGTFNIAEPNRYLSTDNARTELGWDATFRLEKE